MREKGSLVGTWALGTALCALATAGCHEHVELRAPTRDAPLQEREESYESLRPVSMHETHTTYLRNGVAVGASRSTDYLQLENGTRVYYPEDIQPVVSETSPAWLAAGESQSARATANTVSAIGIGGMVVGGGVMLAPIFSHDPEGTINMTPIYIGGAIMIAGAICQLVSTSFRSTANDEAATAFETYDSGLRDRLNLKAPKTRPSRPRPAADEVDGEAATE